MEKYGNVLYLNERTEINKEFMPDVDTMIINNTTSEIGFRNEDLPNLKHIISDSSNYKSNDNGFLIRTTYRPHQERIQLQKVFGQHEFIDLEGVTDILDYSLSGCGVKEIDHISGILNASKESFSGTYFEGKDIITSKSGETLILNLPDNTDEFEVPPGIVIIPSTVEFKNIKRIKLRASQLRRISLPYIETIEIDCSDDNDDIVERFIEELKNLPDGNPSLILKNSKKYRMLENGIIYFKDTLVYCPSSLTGVIDVPEGTKTIDIKAFKSSKIQKINLPDTLTEIEEEAFCKSSIQEVTFGNSLRIIKSYAFIGCENIKRIVLPDSLFIIGRKAFSECSSLHYIEVGKNTTAIGPDFISDSGSDITLVFRGKMPYVAPRELSEVSELIIYGDDYNHENIIYSICGRKNSDIVKITTNEGVFFTPHNIMQPYPAKEISDCMFQYSNNKKAAFKAAWLQYKESNTPDALKYVIENAGLVLPLISKTEIFDEVINEVDLSAGTLKDLLNIDNLRPDQIALMLKKIKKEDRSFQI